MSRRSAIATSLLAALVAIALHLALAVVVVIYVGLGMSPHLLWLTDLVIYSLPVSPAVAAWMWWRRSDGGEPSREIR